MRLDIPISLRWSDLDAYAHVNNTAVVYLLEEVRTRAFWAPADGRSDPVAPAVLDGRTRFRTSRQEVEYAISIPFQRLPLNTELWLSDLGSASAEINYLVKGPAGEHPENIYIRAMTDVDLVDSQSGEPREWLDYERQALQRFVEEPVRFKLKRYPAMQ